MLLLPGGTFVHSVAQLTEVGRLNIRLKHVQQVFLGYGNAMGLWLYIVFAEQMKELLVPVDVPVDKNVGMEDVLLQVVVDPDISPTISVPSVVSMHIIFQ